MPYIFGPVPSRRLGLSLGIDLVPRKTCTYDCLYCQVGRTTCKTIDSKPYTPIKEVLDELRRCLSKTQPDTITLAGSGEPTLNTQIDHIISSIKTMTDIKIAVLTNGSLLWKKEIRSRILEADVIMPTLTTVFEDTFQAVHRPHAKLKLPAIIEGLEELRQAFQGRIFLEVVLLAGFNDNDKEIKGLKQMMHKISPDKIQLNTVVRPPSDSRAKALDRQKLEHVKLRLGEKAEIIAHTVRKKEWGQRIPESNMVLEMAKRRPVRAIDIAYTLNKSVNDVETLLKGLLIKGILREQEHNGERFYVPH
jgi:wyosine [tRNA(Phe)-imidazoG37] synthetase (radical SAM superfamily)